MYIVDVKNSLEVSSHRLVESTLDNTTRNTLEYVNLTSRRKNIGFLVDWVLKTFNKGLLGFNQANPAKTKLSLFLFWKILYDITQISEATTNRFEKLIKKFIDASWGIVSINYNKLQSYPGEHIDTDYVDSGACISLCLSKKKIKPLDDCLYMNVFRDKIVFKSRIGLRINEDYLSTILTVKGDYSLIFDENNLVTNDNLISKDTFDTMRTQYTLESPIGLAPIDMSALKIKSAKNRGLILSMMTIDKLVYKHHIIGLESVKNMSSYVYLHNAEIDVYSSVSGEYKDTLYIIDNVVYFRSAFRCEDIGDIFTDILEEYAGEMSFDIYESFFYYKMKQRSIDDLYIQPDGLQFKLELFFATV